MLDHNYIGTEHILLGLIREGEGVAAQVLQKLGASLDVVRQKVIEVVSGLAGPAREFVAYEGQEEPTASPRCPRCRAALAEHISFTVLTATEHQGEGSREMVVSFCDSCGTALGAWGA